MPFTIKAETQIFSLLLHMTLTLQIKYSLDYELGARDSKAQTWHNSLWLPWQTQQDEVLKSNTGCRESAGF